MDPAQHPDPAPDLPFDIYYQLVHTLRGALPLPVADTPEELARRDHAALAQVASLIPANADEANIGALYVAAGAHAMDCLRQIREHPDDARRVQQLTAQSASMMRQARGHRSLLLRVQAARQKREATSATRDSDAWTEHCALGLMTEALANPPTASLVATPPADPLPAPAAAPPPPETAPPQPAESMPRRAPAVVPLPRRSAPMLVETDEPQPDPAAEAETYALLYPRRAWLIRRLGGVPGDCDFGPPEPELVQAIVTGSSPALRALDARAAAAE